MPKTGPFIPALCFTFLFSFAALGPEGYQTNRCEAAAQTQHSIHHSLNVFATTAAVAKATTSEPNRIDGVDLLPHLTGGKAEAPHQRLFWRTGGGAKFAVREGDWKLVAEDPAKVQLFNLANDISEAKGVATERPEVLARLRQAYDEWNKQNVAPVFSNPTPNAAKKAAKKK